MTVFLRLSRKEVSTLRGGGLLHFSFRFPVVSVNSSQYVLFLRQIFDINGFYLSMLHFQLILLMTCFDV